MIENALTIIVPITLMAGKFQNLNSWIFEASGLGIRVLLIHDVRDDATSIELNNLVDTINSQNVSLFEESFGNQGAARNFGLAKARTEWIVFWDSDDQGAPSEVVEAITAEASRTDLIIGQFRVANSESQNKFVSDDKTLMDLPKNLGLWRMAFRRELISEIRFPDLQMAEDQVFFGKVLTREINIRFCTKVFYTYVQGNPGQITKNKEALLQIPYARKELWLTLFAAREPFKKFIISLMIMRLFLSDFKRKCLWRFYE